ncbi:MAG: chorismate synthase [Ignavibacteriae bacterium]|nr:chorismate synthase [Ignavibacteriota bacterium]
MAGNSFGRFFRITTFGESHGRAVGVVIDGVKPGMPIDTEFIQHELDRRRPGQSKVTTARQESDRVELLSGVFEGRTSGTPICMIVWNKDQQPKAYEKIKNMFRPGHAGYTYLAKYGISDYRGGGRSSGRETASRVAAGALAKAWLAEHGIEIFAYTLEVAGVRAKTIDLREIEKNSLRAPDAEAARKMEKRVLRAKREGDSVGGIVEVVVKNPPAGLGEPVFDKLEADLSKALMSIGAIKGFEIGNGFAAARLTGSENNDPMYFDKKLRRVRTRTNNAGGIAGGISNGEDIVVRIAVKPPSSIVKEQETVTIVGESALISLEGRHDPCICPRVVPVAESMVALVLLDHLTRQELMKRKSSLKDLRDTLALVDQNLEMLDAERRSLIREIKWLMGRRRTRIKKRSR